MDGTVITTVSATDLDSGLYGSISYSIVAGNDMDLFTIDPIQGM